MAASILKAIMKWVEREVEPPEGVKRNSERKRRIRLALEEVVSDRLSQQEMPLRRQTIPEDAMPEHRNLPTNTFDVLDSSVGTTSRPFIMRPRVCPHQAKQLQS